MQDEIHKILHMLSSKSIMERKTAIKMLSRCIHKQEAHLARLSLHYVSIHDPSYTVRNIARQAFYKSGAPPDGTFSWERTHTF